VFCCAVHLIDGMDDFFSSAVEGGAEPRICKAAMVHWQRDMPALRATWDTRVQVRCGPITIFRRRWILRFAQRMWRLLPGRRSSKNFKAARQRSRISWAALKEGARRSLRRSDFRGISTALLLGRFLSARKATSWVWRGRFWRFKSLL